MHDELRLRLYMSTTQREECEQRMPYVERGRIGLCTTKRYTARALINIVSKSPARLASSRVATKPLAGVAAMWNAVPTPAVSTESNSFDLLYMPYFRTYSPAAVMAQLSKVRRAANGSGFCCALAACLIRTSKGFSICSSHSNSCATVRGLSVQYWICPPQLRWRNRAVAGSKKSVGKYLAPRPLSSVEMDAYSGALRMRQL